MRVSLSPHRERSRTNAIGHFSFAVAMTLYCLRCRKHTQSREKSTRKDRRGRTQYCGKCTRCGVRKMSYGGWLGSKNEHDSESDSDAEVGKETYFHENVKEPSRAWLKGGLMPNPRGIQTSRGPYQYKGPYLSPIEILQREKGGGRRKCEPEPFKLRRGPTGKFRPRKQKRIGQLEQVPHCRDRVGVFRKVRRHR